ncbi:MAG: hypothetical protein F7B18_00750 [Desulfurococcales archaeon]|nr:hypothetical protein [Desulfurococcales archaeon]
MHGGIPIAQALHKLVGMMTIKIEKIAGEVRVIYGDGKTRTFNEIEDLYTDMEARLEAWATSMGMIPVVAFHQEDHIVIDEGICSEEIIIYTILVGRKPSILRETIYTLKLVMKSETRGCRIQRTITPLDVKIEEEPLPSKSLTPKAYRIARLAEKPGLPGEYRDVIMSVAIVMAVHELHGATEANKVSIDIMRLARSSRVYKLIADALRTI